MCGAASRARVRSQAFDLWLRLPRSTLNCDRGALRRVHSSLTRVALNSFQLLPSQGHKDGHHCRQQEKRRKSYCWCVAYVRLMLYMIFHKTHGRRHLGLLNECFLVFVYRGVNEMSNAPTNCFHEYASTIALFALLLKIQNGQAAAQYGGTKTHP